MKIGVLEVDQDACAVPRHSLSPTKARRLVRELRWAIQTSRDRIHLTVAHSWSVIKIALKPILPKADRPARPQYIPEELPPAEVPNCYFSQPASASWRIVRPMVDFMLPEERHLAG